jgi:hypothetical protein
MVVLLCGWRTGGGVGARGMMKRRSGMRRRRRRRRRRRMRMMMMMMMMMTSLQVCINQDLGLNDGLEGSGFGTLNARWGERVAQEIELDLRRAFTASETVINTQEGRDALRR